MDSKYVSQWIRGKTAGAFLLLSGTAALAGHHHPFNKEPTRPYMSPACLPAWGHHQTCWKRFPPVPPCEPNGSCPLPAGTWENAPGNTFGMMPQGELSIPQGGPVYPPMMNESLMSPQAFPAPMTPGNALLPVPDPALSTPPHSLPSANYRSTVPESAPAMPQPPAPPLPGLPSQLPPQPTAPLPADPGPQSQSRYGRPQWVPASASSPLLVPQPSSIVPVQTSLVVPDRRVSVPSVTSGSVRYGVVGSGPTAGQQELARQVAENQRSVQQVPVRPVSSARPHSGQTASGVVSPNQTKQSAAEPLSPGRSAGPAAHRSRYGMSVPTGMPPMGMSQVVVPSRGLIAGETAEPLISTGRPSRPLKPTP